MSFIRLFLRYNLRSLRARGTDAFTTLAGIALTAAVLVVVLALAHGLENAFASSGHDDVGLLMYKSADAENVSIVDIDTPRIIEAFPGIARDASGAALISPEVVVLVNLPRRGDGSESNVVIRGVTDMAFALRPEVKVIAGRKPTPDVAEVIVGRRLAERFQNCGLGETVQGFGRHTFKVVGVFESSGATESEIWGFVRDVQGAFDRRMYSSIRVGLQQPAPDSLKALSEAMAKDSRLKVAARLERTYYGKQQDTAAAPIKAVAWILAICMAVGASLGAMNTMYARVATRAREIGTLRAVGFRRGTIVLGFMAESVALSLGGGAIGCLVALPIHGLATGTTNFQTFSEIAFAFAIGPRAIVPALALSAFVGLLGGFLPSLQAALVPIPQALREI